MPSLHERRNKIDMVQTYKIVMRAVHHVQKVRKKILGLKPHSAAGLDGIW